MRGYHVLQAFRWSQTSSAHLNYVAMGLVLRKAVASRRNSRHDSHWLSAMSLVAPAWVNQVCSMAMFCVYLLVVCPCVYCVFMFLCVPDCKTSFPFWDNKVKLNWTELIFSLSMFVPRRCDWPCLQINQDLFLTRGWFLTQFSQAVFQASRVERPTLWDFSNPYLLYKYYGLCSINTNVLWLFHLSILLHIDRLIYR